MLDAAKVKIVILGCGSWELIKGYKGSSALQASSDSDACAELLKTPFEIYSDPSKRIYTSMGMTCATGVASTLIASGIAPLSAVPSLATSRRQSFRPCSALSRTSTRYVSLSEAVRKLTLPQWGLKNAGDIKQLGGEFVFTAQGNVFAVRAIRADDPADHLRTA